MIKTLRTVHFYLGTLFAPSLIFFALSGALQLFDLHEDHPPGWIQKLAEVHKIQSAAEIPKRPPRPRPPEAATARAPEGPPRPQPKPIPRSTPLKYFFLAMAVALIVSTVLGLVMAFTYKRDRKILFGLLVLGTALPIVMLAIL